MSKYFSIDELVDPWFLANHTEDECWAMLDPLAVKAIVALREKFGPVRINGHGYTESGLRRMNTTTGAKYSMHKSGCAFDLKFLTTDVTPRKVFEWITTHQKEAYAMGIRRVEDIAFTPTWLHIDSKPTGENNINKIVIVKP